MVAGKPPSLQLPRRQAECLRALPARLLSWVVMKIDAHVHVFSPAVVTERDRYLDRDLTFRSLYREPKARTGSTEELLDSMNRCGIDRAVLVNIGWTTQELCRESNEYLLESAQRWPSRLSAFCSVNPLAGTQAVEEVERCARRGACGIGELHPDTQGFDLGDPTVMGPVMEAAAQYGLPVLTHASEPVGHAYAGKGLVTPHVLYRFITNFPEARIICAHWGGGLPFYALMPEVRQAMVNVSFDTAASAFLYEPEVFERVTALVGPQKILFGTDFPLIKQERLLRQVTESGLADEAQEAILGGNAARMLGLAPD